MLMTHGVAVILLDLVKHYKTILKSQWKLIFIILPKILKEK